MRTRPFQIPRLRLAYVAAEEYLRSLWWFAATVPAFGVVAIIFGSGLLQVIGLAGILWPLSIPARGIVSTRRAARLFSAGCFADVNEEFLTFYDTTDRPKPLRWRVPLWRVRDVVERRDFLIVRMRMLDFVAVPMDAFDTGEDLANFERIIRLAVEKRLNA